MRPGQIKNAKYEQRNTSKNKSNEFPFQIGDTRFLNFCSLFSVLIIVEQKTLELLPIALWAADRSQKPLKIDQAFRIELAESREKYTST